MSHFDTSKLMDSGSAGINLVSGTTEQSAEADRNKEK